VLHALETKAQNIIKQLKAFWHLSLLSPIRRAAHQSRKKSCAPNYAAKCSGWKSEMQICNKAIKNTSKLTGNNESEWRNHSICGAS